MVVRKGNKKSKKGKKKEQSFIFHDIFSSKEEDDFGQFFLIFAAVMIMVLFTIIAQYNTIRVQTTLEDFDELSDQYSEEQPKVINAAIYEGASNEEVAEDLADFTEDFVDYSRQRQPEFGLYYALNNPDGSITIHNFMANGRTIKLTPIRTGSNGIPLEDATISLLSSMDEAQGSISLNIAGYKSAISVSTPISSYGSVSETTIRGTDRIRIEIPGLSITEISVSRGAGPAGAMVAEDGSEAVRVEVIN